MSWTEVCSHCYPNNPLWRQYIEYCATENHVDYWKFEAQLTEWWSLVYNLAHSWHSAPFPPGLPENDWTNPWTDDGHQIGQGSGGGEEIAQARDLLRQGTVKHVLRTDISWYRRVMKCRVAEIEAKCCVVLSSDFRSSQVISPGWWCAYSFSFNSKCFFSFSFVISDLFAFVLCELLLVKKQLKKEYNFIF